MVLNQNQILYKFPKLFIFQPSKSVRKSPVVLGMVVFRFYFEKEWVYENRWNLKQFLQILCLVTKLTKNYCFLRNGFSLYDPSWGLVNIFREFKLYLFSENALIYKLCIIVFGAADFILEYETAIIITVQQQLFQFLKTEYPLRDVWSHCKDKNDRVDAYGSPHKSLSIQDSLEGKMVKLEES